MRPHPYEAPAEFLQEWGNFHCALTVQKSRKWRRKVGRGQAENSQRVSMVPWVQACIYFFITLCAILSYL